MADRELHRERVQRLLAQDQEINDTQLKEFRMQLEQNLEAWEAVPNECGVPWYGAWCCSQYFM